MSGNNGGAKDKDPLQDLIDEAESLMATLDHETGQIFSIDDSDEEGGDKATVDDDPLSAAMTTKKSTVEDHPLSMTQLTTTTVPPPATTTMPTPLGTTTTTPSTPMMTATTTTMDAVTVGVTHFFSNETADQVKLQTSRFASGIASIAQRAANQVAAAAAPVHVANGPPLQSHSIPSSSTTTMPSSTSSSFLPSTTPYPGAQMQQQQQQAAANHRNPSSGAGGGGPGRPPNNFAKSSVEMDKDQQESLVKEHIGDLLPGERVILFLGNLLHVGDTMGLSYLASQASDAYMWCCAVSYYRLILFSTATSEMVEVTRPAEWNTLCWPTTPAATMSIEIPLGSIDRVDKTVYQAMGSSFMGIIVYTKDCGRIIRFTTPNYVDTGKVYDSINTYAFPGRRNLGYLFAFESKRHEVMASIQIDNTTGQQNITLPPTPKRFDPMMEYPRLLSKTSITNAPWTIWATVNSAYHLSQTYPSVLVGPATLDESKQESQHVIHQCAAFRSEQRLPALAWCGTGGASIWRASQPKVGLQGNRSPADELFLRHIAESARGANAMADPAPIYSRATMQQLTGDYNKDWVPEPGCGLKILDLRPRASAMANRTGGYGYENTSYYNNSTLQFCNIGNIHSVRDSYQKLCNVCNGESSADINFLSLIEDTKWLSHIRTILAASWETAYWVHVWRMPVLLHCSHGWDRTSQVSALAQLLLDPFYRTQQGFSVLVEKDFMSFGHPFHLRCAHGESRNQTVTPQANDEGQISPIFLQFLDCVYQIVQLLPECFEFNTKYLLDLSFQIYTCRFGNMLCDTERERETLAGIRLRTYSVWDYLDNKADCHNESFRDESGGVLLMPLSMLLRNVNLWKDRHCRYSRRPTLREGLK